MRLLFLSVFFIQFLFSDTIVLKDLNNELYNQIEEIEYLGRVPNINSDNKRVNSKTLGIRLDMKKNNIHVMHVAVNSLAEKAGFWSGDIITKINGNSIESIDQISEYIKNTNYNDYIDFTVIRKSFFTKTEKNISLTFNEEYLIIFKKLYEDKIYFINSSDIASIDTDYDLKMKYKGQTDNLINFFDSESINVDALKIKNERYISRGNAGPGLIAFSGLLNLIASEITNIETLETIVDISNFSLLLGGVSLYVQLKNIDDYLIEL